MIIKFKIADLYFELDLHKDLLINESYQPFITSDDNKETCLACFELTDQIKISKAQSSGNSILGIDYDHKIFRDDENGYIICYFQPGKDQLYAQSRFDSVTQKAYISILESYDFKMNSVNSYFHMIGWEKMMLLHDRMILHSSCIRTSFGGILFSGQSGIGKSTQADLWCNLRNSELINGDRTILYRKDNEWTGFGSPFAGSSRCFKNESAPVRTIVMLEQNTTCSIRKLTINEAFRRVFAELAVYTWDSVYVEKVIDLLLKLLQDVPVYLLSCTPDEEAVITLENFLRQEN